MPLTNFNLSGRSTLLIFSLLIAFLYSCTSSKKAYEHGDYLKSVNIAINKLRKNPDHKKSIETLSEAYPLAISYYEKNIANLTARQDLNRWKGIVETYTAVNNMYENIQRSPGALRVIPNPKNYYPELKQAQQNAAEEQYNFGLAELSKNNREAAKVAYRAFQDAEYYVPGYKDVTKKLEEAYWQAILKVQVQPIPIAYGKVQLSALFFEDKIHERLKTQPINEFVRFMTPGEIDQLGATPDHVLFLRFDQFTIGKTTTLEKQIDRTNDKVVMGKVKNPAYAEGDTTANAQPEYLETLGTVKATLFHFQKTVESNGTLDFRVEDASNHSVIGAEKLSGAFVWKSEWGHFNGDERALTGEDLQITKLKEVQPPNDQILFTEFTIPIYDQLMSKIYNFYGRY